MASPLKGFPCSLLQVQGPKCRVYDGMEVDAYASHNTDSHERPPLPAGRDAKRQRLEELDIILKALLSANPSIRQPAEQQIDHALATNLPLLLNTLADTLADERKSPSVRQLAGVVIKNAVSGRAAVLGPTSAAAWLKISGPERQQVKLTVLRVLASPERVARQTAAHTVAIIGIIELPLNQWPELLQLLVDNVVAQSPNDLLKQASLEALGTICEELTDDKIHSWRPTAPQSNLILTAFMQGMSQAQANPEVRLTGTRALSHSLTLCKPHFEVEGERNCIMQTVCEGTQATHSELKVASLFCLVRIAELYYDKLPAYMPALYQLTLTQIQQATQAEEDDEADAAGRQAIEFWTAICDEEIATQELLAELGDLTGAPAGSTVRIHGLVSRPALNGKVGTLVSFEASKGRYAVHVPGEASGVLLKPDNLELQPAPGTPRPTCHQLIDKSAPQLVPLLLEAMCKQPDEDVGDTESTSTAACNCLAQVAQTIGDQVVAHVAPFVMGEAQSPNWRRQEAAVTAFGTMLQGPTDTTLRPVLQPGIALMIQLLSAPTTAVPVRASATWVFARVFDLFYLEVLTVEQWTATLAPGGLLLRGLRDEPRVAVRAAEALYHLSENFADQTDVETNGLSPLFVGIVEALLGCLQHCTSTAEAHLRTTVFETLMSVVLPTMLETLEHTFTAEAASTEGQEAEADFQASLCGTLKELTAKLVGQIEPPLADRMMEALLRVLGARSWKQAATSAFTAIDSVASATGAHFARYMPQLRPFLVQGITSHEEHETCVFAVGLVGTICRALERSVQPYSDELLHLLIRTLQQPTLHRNIRGPILSCFGDFGLALEGAIEKHLPIMASLLMQAATTKVDVMTAIMTEDDHLNKLRESIFQGYTGVMQGLRTSGQSHLFQPYALGPLDLVRRVVEGLDESNMEAVALPPSEQVIIAAVGVVGDVCSMGPDFQRLTRQSPYKEAVKALLQQAEYETSMSDDAQMKDVLEWVQRQMARTR